MDRGVGAHSESVAMTFGQTLFQSTSDLNLFMIMGYDCISNENAGVTCDRNNL